VALQPAFEQLWSRLHELRDAVLAMQLTVVEDRPRGSDVVPVQDLGEAVGDLLAAVQEALAAASDGLAAAGSRSEPAAVPEPLLRAQAAANAAARLLATGVADRARLADLDDLARSRGRAWALWLSGVTEAVDRCGPPLWETQQSLMSCWSELTDRLVGRLVPPTADTASQL
jgi:hypothetical protein